MSAGPGPRRAWIAAAIAACAALALFFSPALAGRGQFLYRDAGRYYHPVKRLIAAELRAGRLPQWNPYQGLGVSVVAGAIDSVMHPLNALFLALPFEAAFTAWVVLCFALAAGGVLAWCRALGLPAAAAALAALAYALSGFLVSSSDNLVHLVTMAGAPWVLAAARAHAARGGAGALAALGAASFVCAAGGEVLDLGVAAALALAQTAAATDGPARRRVARTLAAGAAIAAGAAPVVVPFAVGLAGSSRGAALDVAEAARWNLHPRRLAELFVPHLARAEHGRIQDDVYVALTGDVTPTPWVASLYLGAPVLALAILGAARARAARLLLLAAAVLLWAAMGHHAGFGAVATRVPVLASVRYFERLAGWPTLLVAVAAAFGAARLREDARGARALAAGAGLCAALLVAAASVARSAPEAVSAALLPPGPADAATAARLAANVADGALEAGLALGLAALLALLAARGRAGRALPAALAALVAVDLAAANARAYLLSDPATLYPPDAPIPRALERSGALVRVATPFALDRERWPELLPFESGWRWGALTAASAFDVAYRVGNVGPYGGVAPGRLARLVREGPPGAWVLRTGLFGVAAVVVPHRPARAAEVGLAPPWRVLAADPDLPAWAIEIPHRPRFYLAGPLVRVDADAALRFAASAQPADEKRTAVESDVPDGYAEPAGEVRLVADDPGRTVLEADADRPALVVLNDQAEAGWTARVDGRPAAIVTANAVARAVWVPAGRHRIAFRYATPGLAAGWAILAAGAASLLGVALARRARRPRRALDDAR